MTAWRLRVETIVSIAANEVEGVASVGSAAAGGLRSVFGAKPSTQGIDIAVDEDDKLAVYRARKIQKFLSQPFNVAEVFTGLPGKYVPVRETIRGFKMIVEGAMDELPENAFFNVGTIDEAIAKAEAMKQESKES